MKKINKSVAFLLLLIPTYLCAMERDNDTSFGNIEFDSLKNSPQLMKKTRHIDPHNQNQGAREEEENSKNVHTSNSFSCWDNTWSFWDNMRNMGKELLGWNQNSDEESANIHSLTNELLWHLAGFLSSLDTLRLSNTCKKFRKVFNDDYWIAYLSEIPTFHSYLTREGPLSPSLHRKRFFSHLWYSEGYIRLAAKLNHPEASVMQEYGYYIGGYYGGTGVKERTIGKDQYFCPSGVIKDINGNVDRDRMNRLMEVKREKNKIAMEVKEAKDKKDMEESRIRFTASMLQMENPRINAFQAYMRAYCFVHQMHENPHAKREYWNIMP